MTDTRSRTDLVIALVWCGLLLLAHWRTLTGAFTVSFPLSGMRRVGGFSTDAHGRYCVAWAAEANPTANIGGLAVPLQVIDAPGRPIPPGCQEGDAGIPWKHADDLTSSPRYLSLLFAILIAGAILMGGLAYAGDTRPARLHREAGLAMTVASTLLFAVLWL